MLEANCFGNNKIGQGVYFTAQPIDLSMERMAWQFWMMRQSNGCSTPSPRSSAAKEWIERTAQTMNKKCNICTTWTSVAVIPN